MSDTPRTDAAWNEGFDPVILSAAKLARRLRKQCAELERENAALRKAKDILEVERCECLRTMDLALNESAGLRGALEELQAMRLKDVGDLCDEVLEKGAQP